MGVHPRAPSKGVQTLVQSQFIPLRAIADHSRRTYKIASSLARKAVARIASPRLLSRDEDRERRLSHCPAHSWPPLSRLQLGGHRGCGGCWRRAALTSIQPVTYRSVSRVGAYFRAYFRVPRELPPSCSLEAGTDPLGTCSRSRGGGTINRGGTVNRT